MTRADLSAVLAIEQSVFTVPWTTGTFRTLMLRAGARLWVAEWDGEVIGYAAVWAVLDQAELGNVAVAPAHRRRGVASKLVETVLQWLEQRRVREVFLEVRASNREAQRLYERHGFRPVGRRKGYYSRPREDALVLRRTVTSVGMGLTD
jgi:ribosomal-protein-alanine N-acetyltransferase